MNAITCNTCQAALQSNATFCSECGARQTCKSCSYPLAKGAKFCSDCGLDVASSITDSTKNTLTYRKTKDEVYCNVNLTDEVGKTSLEALIKGITGGHAGKSLSLGTHADKVAIEDVDFKIDEGSENIIDGNSSQHVIDDKKVEQENSPATFPHLDDLGGKRNYTELEWVLLFSFYASNFGSETFTREQVQKDYLAKRKTLTRQKGFTDIWKILRKSFFTTVTEGIFRISPEKILPIGEFVNGKLDNITKGSYVKNPGGAAKKNPAVKTEEKKSTKQSSSAKSIKLEEFDVQAGPGKTSLQDFHALHKPKNNKILLGMLAYYICVLNKESVFSAGKIDYACKVLKVDRKNNLIQIVNNVKNDTLWFDGAGSGSWKLTRLGEVELEKTFNA